MPKLFIALDFPGFEESVRFIKRIEGARGIGFKVGLQLFLADGRKIMDYLNQKGFPVFLDLKFNDIPNTVAGAVRSVQKYYPYMINMHITAGQDAIVAAREEIEMWDKKPLLIGVTILTSLLKEDLEIIGFQGIKDLESLVINMSRAGHESGLDGVVTSNHEAEGIKKSVSSDFITVVPGIRIGSGGKDQKRIATIDDARASGTDYIVIGRSITGSEDPMAVIDAIMDKIDLFDVH